MNDQDDLILDQATTPTSKITIGEGILIALAVIAMQFVAAIIGTVVAIPMVGMEGLTDPDGMDKVMSIVTGVALIISFPMAVWWILRKRSLSDTAFKWDNSFFYLLPLAAIFLYAVAYCIGGLMEYLPGYDGLVDQYTAMFENINPTLLIIGGVFIGPICEEIIFRGVILRGFLQSFSPNKAIALSSLIFGVIHFIPLQVVSAFFAGLVLGYVYYKTKSLWLPILMHILHNAIAFMFSDTEMGVSTRESYDNDLFYFGSFMLAVAIAYGIYAFMESRDISVDKDTAIV